ncbi:MAG: tetratricopeptide repeat protein [Promethearchaeota archaeon]
MESIIKPEEYLQAEELIYQAKFDDALELISNFKRSTKKDSMEWLWGLILEGRINCYKGQYKRAIEIGNIAYLLSRKLDLVLESVEALLIRAHIIYLAKREEAFEIITLAEKIFNSLLNDSTSNYPRQKAEILLLKSEIYRSRGELNEAFELARECLLIQQNLKNKIDISNVYYHLANLYLYNSDSNSGLEYALKSLTIQEELGYQSGIAGSLYLVGTSYFVRGNFDQALKLGRQSLKSKEISTLTKLEVLDLLAMVFLVTGQLDRALKYRKRAAIIAQKENYEEQYIISTYGIATNLRAKGEFDLAVDYLKKSLKLSENTNSTFGIMASLFHLILTTLDNNNPEQAKFYLSQLEKYCDQTESDVFKNVYLISKALVLKNSGRIRNLSEAEIILRGFTEKEIETPLIYRLAMVNLCELFLEELKFTNNVEVLEDIIPLINKIYKIAEKQSAYAWLVEIKILQAKISLIQMDFDAAEQLLTQAQRIAELQGLTLLALKISSEHDNLLNQLSEWNNLKKIDAPMSERIELASFDGVVERLQGKSTIDPPLITPETPVLLLIIGQGGFPLFSNQFEEGHQFEEDLLSGFLDAINSFSGELLSKQLDRVKFEDYMILMQTVENFSVGYLFKGQTYIAKQKLTQFTESIKKDSTIWHTLNVYFNTSRVVKLEDLPSLQALIFNIFIK